MELGAFSVSLTVKDMAASRAFYSKLGFEMIAGDGESWTITANQSVVVGLFQGMFDENSLRRVSNQPTTPAEQRQVDPLVSRWRTPTATRFCSINTCEPARRADAAESGAVSPVDNGNDETSLTIPDSFGPSSVSR